MNWARYKLLLISGGITVVVWKQLSGGLFDVYELVPGFVLSALVILVTGHLAPARGQVREAYREALRAE